MKQVVTTILFLCSLAPVALLAKAKSPEEAYVESFAGRSDVPVPISVVRPIVDSIHEGQRVWLSFIVDGDGVPREIAAPVDADHDLVKQLARAVSQWRFKPLVRDGVAVRARVTLPLVIATDAETLARR
jgi:hypothetical protein